MDNSITGFTQKMKAQGFTPQEIAGAIAEHRPEVAELIKVNPTKMTSIIGYDADAGGVEDPSWYADPTTYVSGLGGYARKPVMGAVDKIKEALISRGLGRTPKGSYAPDTSKIDPMDIATFIRNKVDVGYRPTAANTPRVVTSAADDWILNLK